MENTASAILRPLRLGELLDRAIRLYRANFLTYIGIIAVVYVPLMILQTAASALLSSSMFGGFRTPDELFTNTAYWAGMGSTVILAFLQFILVQGFATGALTRSVADNYLGRKTGIVDAYRGIGGSWVSLLGALLLLGLFIIVSLIWWLVPCIGWVTGIGIMFFLVAVVNPLIPPVVVLEKQSAVDSVGRAWNLSRRRFWPVLGTVLVLSLFSLIVVNGPAAIANIILAQVFQSFGDSATQLILTSIIQGLVSIVFVLLYYPLQMTAFTLIYFDLRVRTEGFDLALLTREATNETGESDLTDVASIPAPPTSEKFITGPDLGNFAILTIAGFALYIFFVSFLMGGIYFLSSLFR